MKNIYLLTLVAALGACTSAPRQPNPNNQIAAEMNRAIEQRAKPAQVDTVNNALLPPLTFELPRGTAKPLDQRFDLVVTGAPANQVFMAIVSGTRYSMLVHPEVTGSISVNLKDVTISEALEAIREMYGYEYKIDGSRIYIQPLTLQTRVFQVNYLNSQRQGRTDLRVISGSVADVTSGGAAGQAPAAATLTNPVASGAPGAPASLAASSGVSSRISTTSQSDFWQELSAALKTIVGTEGGRSVVVSPQSGVLVVRALPAELRGVDNYLKATKLSVERQVMLEAKIIEVTLRDGAQAGVNWSAFRNGGNSRFSGGLIGPSTLLGNSGTIGNNDLASSPGTNLFTSATGTALFGLAFQTSNFAALLQFLDSQGDVQVLSSPRIATINNQKAVLKVGSDEFFVTSINTTPGTSSVTGTTAPTVTVVTQPFFSGIAFDITPQIDENGHIILHVHPSVSEVTTDTKIINAGASIGTLSLPLAKSSVSETDSIVRVDNGNIVAIGGLMKVSSSNDRAQIPVLGDVPVVGSLFRNSNRTQVKSELIILIKPTLIQSEESWRQDLVDTRDRLQQFDTDRRGAQ